ncbi:MAG: hypothetical protein WEA82_05505 [Idiomarina sp.]
MIRISLFGLLGLLLSLTACGDSQKLFSIGGSTYKIPSDYLVMAPSSFDSAELDSDVGMVALSFSHDRNFSDYVGDNAWLPKSPITAILYSREGTELTGFSSSLSNLVGFSIEDKHVVEFEKNYRVFKGDTRISWQTFPKLQTRVGNDEIKAKWMAECIPLGGMKGSDQSRESMDIPTSCKINVEYRNAILSLTTSEKNLVNNAEEIVKLVLQRMDEWRVSF